MSVPLLSVNFYESIFMFIWTFLEIALLVYKNQKYPFPTYAVNIEGGIIAMFVITQVIRYLIVERGILDKNPTAIIFYIILTVFIIPQYVFFLRLQTYSLLIDVIINSVGVGLNVIEIGLAVWVWQVFKRKKNNSWYFVFAFSLHLIDNSFETFLLQLLLNDL